VGGFSLGMRQRLGLAAALLGDPAVLVLDEPANGLDPAGIRWLRQMMRHLAAEGRTILVSSHVLTEVAQTVDDVVIIARGRCVRAAPLHELMAERLSAVRVRGGSDADVRRALAAAGVACTEADGAITVTGAPAERVGEICFRAGIPLHELSPIEEGLEDVFLRLVGA
jgi:ABC-2 type transport system ATP-binding protein